VQQNVWQPLDLNHNKRLTYPKGFGLKITQLKLSLPFEWNFKPQLGEF